MVGRQMMNELDVSWHGDDVGLMGYLWMAA
jgi:hypothetical protein